jgi:Tol biopolymer transport system component
MKSLGYSTGLLIVFGYLGALWGHASGPRFSKWSDPVHLGPLVNSAFQDSQPALSKDGLSLYLSSNRPGGVGLEDIWISQRESTDAPWGAPVNLGPPINTVFADFAPNFSRDGHWMFFTSDRPGGVGAWDLWVSWRRHKHNDFAWKEPHNLGPTVNSPQNDAGPAFVEGKGRHASELLFTSDRPGGQGGFDLYVTELWSSGVFSPPMTIPELNSPGGDSRPAVRRDGREILLVSNRPGTLGTFDLWVATRETILQPWSTPENLGPPINGVLANVQATLSSDGRTMIFASGRPGGLGGLDLYVTTRTKLRGR